MMDTIKEFRQVNIHHLGFATVNHPLRRFYRLVLAPSGTETVTVRRKIRIENGFQQQFSVACTTRSRTVGMPGSRIPLPPGLGISTRRTGEG